MSEQHPSEAKILNPPVREHSNDADLFPLAGVTNNTAKEEVIMTVRKAKRALAQTMKYLHLEDGEFTITDRRLVSRDGAMDYPVRKLVAIIPAHGTVMAIRPGRTN